MKRLATLAGLAFASLIGAFAFTAPAHATTCVTDPASPSTSWPHNSYWYCGGTTNYKTGGFNGLINQGTDAKRSTPTPTVLFNTNHLFFIFATYTDFKGYCGVTTNTPYLACNSLATDGFSEDGPNAVGSTWNNGGTIYYSVVLEDRIENSTPILQVEQRIQNAMAHEAGHQLDYYYGPKLSYSFAASEDSSYGTSPRREFNYRLTFDWNNFDSLTTCTTSGGVFFNKLDDSAGIICNGIQATTVGGTPHMGDVVHMVVTDTSLPGGSETVPYTIKSSDTNASILASSLVNAVNADTVLMTHHISATYLAGPPIQVKFNSTSTTKTYFVTSKFSGTGSETFAASFSGTNEEILQAAWKYFFTKHAPNVHFWDELFAEQNAHQFSNNDPVVGQNPDDYLVYFGCTGHTVQYLATNGTTPADASYSSGCK